MVLRQAAVRCRLIILAFLITRPLCASSAAEAGLTPAPQKEFELRGVIQFADDRKARERITAVLFIEGTTFPYSDHTEAGPGGKFKFKELSPGVYRLTIWVPNGGTMEKTVDVSGSFADSKNRIDLEIEFAADYSRDAASLVSVERLSVPEDAQKRLLQIEPLLKEHDVEQAIQKLQALTDDYPEYSDAWNRLGTIYYLRGEFKQAETHFRRALSLDPGSYPAVVNLGASMLSLGDLGEAEKLNTQAVNMRPQDPLAHSQLGQTLFAQGVIAPAIKHLKLAEELDPGHFSYPQLVLAEIYRLHGQEAQMQREIESFLKYHPDVSFAEDLKKYLRPQKDKGLPENE